MTWVPRTSGLLALVVKLEVTCSVLNPYPCGPKLVDEGFMLHKHLPSKTNTHSVGNFVYRVNKNEYINLVALAKKSPTKRSA